MAANRVERLKDLVALLEQLPASPDRDHMLSEVRSRAVDVDTGVTPRAMLPVRQPTPPPAPVVEPAHSAFATGPSKDLGQTLHLDERLSLEDSPLPHIRAHGNRAGPP